MRPRTPSRPTLWQWVALFAMCSSHVLAQQSRPAAITAVSTADEFEAAMAAGAPHILVTNHLDLRSLPAAPAAAFPTLDPVVFDEPSFLVSLRVRLSSPITTFMSQARRHSTGQS